MKNNIDKIRNISNSLLKLSDEERPINKRFIVFIIKQLLNIGIDILVDKEDNDNKWIDISTPPLEDGSYLVCTKKKSVCTARFYTSMNKFSSRINDSVVAWMPLPKPLSTIDNRKEYI